MRVGWDSGVLRLEKNSSLTPARVGVQRQGKSMLLQGPIITHVSHRPNFSAIKEPWAGCYRETDLDLQYSIPRLLLTCSQQPKCIASNNVHTTGAAAIRHCSLHNRRPGHPAGSEAPPIIPPDVAVLSHRRWGCAAAHQAACSPCRKSHPRRRGSHYSAQAPLTARAELLLLCWPDGSTASTCDMDPPLWSQQDGSSCVLLRVQSQLQLTPATTAMVLWVLPVDCLLGVTPMHTCRLVLWLGSMAGLLHRTCTRRCTSPTACHSSCRPSTPPP